VLGKQVNLHFPAFQCVQAREVRPGERHGFPAAADAQPYFCIGKRDPGRGKEISKETSDHKARQDEKGEKNGAA